MSDRPLFSLGQLVATPGAIAKLEEAAQKPIEFVVRHASGDWGIVDAEDQRANDQAIAEGDRLLSL